jgi:hypothetical protein
VFTFPCPSSFALDVKQSATHVNLCTSDDDQSGRTCIVQLELDRTREEPPNAWSLPSRAACKEMPFYLL